MISFVHVHFSKVITVRERLNTVYKRLDARPAFTNFTEAFEALVVALDEVELVSSEHNRIANQYSNENIILSVPFPMRISFDNDVQNIRYSVTTQQVVFISDTGAICIYRKYAGWNRQKLLEYRDRNDVEIEYEKKDYVDKNVWGT